MDDVMKERASKFECPACGESGIITLPEEMTRFDCPGECGASFLKYQGDGGVWHIRCVVRPVFES